MLGLETSVAVIVSSLSLSLLDFSLPSKKVGGSNCFLSSHGKMRFKGAFVIVPWPQLEKFANGKGAVIPVAQQPAAASPALAYRGCSLAAVQLLSL